MQNIDLDGALMEKIDPGLDYKKTARLRLHNTLLQGRKGEKLTSSYPLQPPA